jgi:hypothetical protein
VIAVPVGSRTFWLPRRGNSPDEYEDAFAADDASGRYAVADGASEGCFTGLWARLLVEDFVAQADCDASPWPAALPAVQARWDADVRARNLDWDADLSVEQGASAAFLGVVLAVSPRPPAEEGQDARADCYRWQAVAVGDTCLLHTRDQVLLRAFPLERSDQFNSRPRLVGARMSLDGVRQRQRTWSDGCGQPGDRLWAMTDALAKWCLLEHEAGGDPWHALEALLDAPPSEDPFAAWIEGLRDAGRLLNDDVTLLAMRL